MNKMAFRRIFLIWLGLGSGRDWVPIPGNCTLPAGFSRQCSGMDGHVYHPVYIPVWPALPGRAFHEFPGLLGLWSITSA